MNEIPEALLRDAESIIYELRGWGQTVDDAHQPTVSERDAAIIARALMAEREQAARIAETLGVHPHLNVFAGGPEWYKHGQAIAAAIRKGQG